VEKVGKNLQLPASLLGVEIWSVGAMLWLYLGRATAQGTGFFLSHSTDGTW